ncbi:hypothetical protein FZD47_02365 [Bacillus infantis]|uniref:YopX protein domain-containing protein n=1 Tax=Bacillus infantis TaxID=324767 RepID=A0A5D4SSJ3_9BACI|nr:YopX family protein [Bacillus infantis]TYS66350.1 hypothetical protein FZD47_02365 [Bacillus infantis]
MREIKFNFYNTRTQKYITWDESNAAMLMCAFYTHEHLKFLQYTGLKSIDNQEIFDGHILQDDEGYKWVVKYKNGAFMAECGDLMAEQLLNTVNLYCKVIGNIYEHSELL